MVTPKVSVVVPHFNDLEHLGLCLDSLSAQDFVDSYEIIIADNRSPIGVDAVRDFVGDRATVIDAPIKGAGPARNAGVDASSGDILAFIDSDCIADRAWLTQGVAALANHDFVGGRVDVLVPSDRPMTGAEAFEKVFAFDNRRYIADEGFTVTANLFCSRALFSKVGGFRTEVSEDKEWCLRAREMGYRIGYAPGAIVGHPAREDWAQLKRKWDRMSAETFALYRDRKSFPRLKWLARTWMLPLSILPHGMKLIGTPVLSQPSQRLSAFGTLVRLRLWRFVDGHSRLLEFAKSHTR